MLKLLPVLLLVVLASACTDSTNTVYVHDLGTYHGKVRQYGVDGNLTSDQTGASVSILGTDFKAVTDTGGNFTIQNVPTGIYNIVISKPGFDSLVIRENEFSGAGTQFLQYNSISRIPFDSIQVLSSEVFIDTIQEYEFWDDSIRETRHDTLYGLKINLTISGPDSATLQYLRVYFTKGIGDTRVLDSVNYDIDFKSSKPFSIPTQKPFELKFGHDYLHSKGFNRGTQGVAVLKGAATPNPATMQRQRWLPVSPIATNLMFVIP